MKNKQGMRMGKKMLSVLLYLVLVSLFLGLQPSELLDLRQLLLVLAGGMILYLPGMEREDFLKWRKPDLELLARNMVYASFLETFVLLFLMLSRGGAAEQAVSADSLMAGQLMREIARNLRPLLYGGCIWMVFDGDREERREKKGQGRDTKVWTAQESYQHFLELGLTRREAEIAVQVGKGLSNKEIAMELNISEATVKKHISNIFEKLDVEKRQEIGEKLTM